MLPEINLHFIEEGMVLATYPLFFGLAVGLFLFAYWNFYPLQKDLSFSLRIVGLSLLSWIWAKIFFLLELDLHPRWSFFARELMFDWNFWSGGGLVFYGGMLGFLSGFFLDPGLTWELKKSFGARCAPLFCWAHAVGRVGCFLGGCCFGHGIGPGGPLKEVFVRHPVQLYEACTLVLLAVFLWKRNSKGGRHVFLQYVFFYALCRFGLEFFRAEPIRGMTTIFGHTLSFSQWMSLILVGGSSILRLVPLSLLPLSLRWPALPLKGSPVSSKRPVHPRRDRI